MTEISVKVQYFTYGQNNSGGGFTYNPAHGIGQFVIIEAINANHANQRAREIGLYFDGSESGMDCSCCGDRWYAVWDEKGTVTPMVYNETPDEWAANPDNFKWNMGKSIFVHYISGQITAY